MLAFDERIGFALLVLNLEETERFAVGFSAEMMNVTGASPDNPGVFSPEAFA